MTTPPTTSPARNAPLDVAAVVVNFRTAEATIDGVRVLVSELAGARSPRVVVVDNDSRDGSYERLIQEFADPRWQGQVAVIASGHNGGYGFGINVGVRHLRGLPEPPAYVYVVNPDATIDPGALARLVTFMDQHPSTGMVGNRVYGDGDDSEVRAFRFPSVWGELELSAKTAVLTRLLRRHIVPMLPDQSCEVDWVSGASMLIRRTVFDTVGLFDEGYFLYFEEVDFARRLRDAGWKVHYVDGAGLRHVGSLATGMADQTRPMPAYWFQARRRYFVKHHGPLYGAACDAAWLAGHALFVTKAKVLGRRPVLRPRLWRDFLRYSAANFLKPAPEAEQNAHRGAGTRPGT